MPELELPAGFAQDPAAERHDDAGVLGELDEIGRLRETAFGARPPYEGFEGGKALAAGERHDRLIVQLEVAVLDRPSQIVLERQSRQGLLANAEVEDFDRRG